MAVATYLIASPSVLSTEGNVITNDHSESRGNGFSANTILKECSKLKDLKQVHGQMVKRGLLADPIEASKLIASCVGLGNSESLIYARKTFEKCLEEDKANLFMWNSMLRGYCNIGLQKEAFSLYQKMMIGGAAPDRYTFPLLIRSCAGKSDFTRGIELHASLVKLGMEDDVYIVNSLIHFYSECGELDSARNLFVKMSEKNVISWTSLICGYSHDGNPREAISLFEEMKKAEGVKPNSVTMACVFSACAKLKNLELGEEIWDYTKDSEIGFNAVLVNAMVDMYFKCGVIAKAETLFHESTDRNIVLWNTMVTNYVRLGHVQKAFEVFNEMILAGTEPDRVTMVAVIAAAAQLGVLVVGREFHGYVVRHGLDFWETVNNALIDMYMKCGVSEKALLTFDLMRQKTVVSWNTVIAGLIRNGDMDNAFKLFNKMPERDLVSWNTMIGGLVQESLFEEAIRVFREMQQVGVVADRVTMVSVVSACGYIGALGLAKWVHAYIDRNGISLDMRLSTAMVDMYARCGDPKTSMQMFDKMHERDVSSWTASIGAMAMKGNGKRAIEMFKQMIDQGIVPDGVAFVAILTACSHSGLVYEGRQIFQAMTREFGIIPEMVHYGCMVDLLGRAGLLQEAKEFIEMMPFEPNDIVWGALLAACRTHPNPELTEYAAKKVMKLAPYRPGIHVLLSNLYASIGQWDDVARVRLHLKENGIQKSPGSSSIEVGGEIHEFTSGEESHPQFTHIERMLDEIESKLRLAGHIPDIATILLDVDEEEKGYLLSRHSEKLAVAFGLITTVLGEPIRITKNLRICIDCHTYVKMVSKIYNREIVIRDNNRFHFFRQGSCSCMDYW